MTTKTKKASKAKAPKAAKVAKAAKSAKAAAAPKAEKAPKAAKEAKAPKAAKLSQRAQKLADAEAGKLPAALDFSAMTHRSYRGKLAEVEALVKAKDLKGLKSFKLEPRGSRLMISKWRDLCVTALEAQKGRKAA